uniref:Uncharacterized protein n=1 Tax=Marseillevirus LCMAC201 TaxID=2506605 RepID=A0A481YVD1_9VIRU|nr:MAG: hypothetical protein LCMAC201_00240 [Marseillevirus LCMAC201]
MNIVDKLIAEGWYLTIVDQDHHNTTRYYILPPDDRKKWGAKWTQVPYGSLVILLPHYYNDAAIRNSVGVPTDAPASSSAGMGMPSRFGKRTMY